MDTSQIQTFILTLKDKVKIEEQKCNLRMTTKGLFVADSYKPKVADLYNGWIEELSGEKPKRSNEKTQIKLFGEATEKLCLTEGKDLIFGSVMECPVQDLQKFRLPTYQGSLVSSRDYLHPKDSIFDGTNGISLRSDTSGSYIQFKALGKTIELSFSEIKKYREIFCTSKKVKRDFPDVETTLTTSVKILHKLLQKAKFIRETETIFVPQKMFKDKNIHYLQSDNFIFILENTKSFDTKRVVKTYFLKDEALYEFMREEFEQLEKESKTKRFESFQFAPTNYLQTKNKFLGEFIFPSTKYFLKSHALKQYIEAVMKGNIEHIRYKGLFNIKHVIRNFFEAFKLARPIEYRLVKNLLPEKFTTKEEYRIAEGFVFALSREGDIEGCFCKY